MWCERREEDREIEREQKKCKNGDIKKIDVRKCEPLIWSSTFQFSTEKMVRVNL